MGNHLRSVQNGSSSLSRTDRQHSWSHKMRCWIPVFVSIFALAMGLPTPESPAVVKIPKPGINLQEDKTPLSEPEKIKINSRPFKLIPTPVEKEPVFPLSEPKEVSKQPEIALKFEKFPVFPQENNEAFKTVPFPSRFEDGRSIQPSVDSLKAIVPVESLGSPFNKPLPKFNSDKDAIEPSVSALKAIVPVKNEGDLQIPRFIDDKSSIEPSVRALKATVPVKSLGIVGKEPLPAFTDDATPIDASVRALTATVPSEHIPLFEEDSSLSKPLSEPVFLENVSPAIIQVPLSAPVSVPQPIMTSPMLVRVVPDPVSVPDPPMPSLSVPFTGGMYHSQGEAGQYSFSHWGGPNTRMETRDLAGVVSGSFAYVNPVGEIQVRKYVAGPMHGFRVAASDLPVDIGAEA